MADNWDLATALAQGPTTADVLGRMPKASPMTDLRGYLTDYFRQRDQIPTGALASALAEEPPKQEPNMLGKAMSYVPPEVMLMANFLGPKAPLPRINNPIRAYHGSPHDFERFDASKIGTGEGAQSYGHG